MLIADIRDTRFAHNPFELMHRGSRQYDLFINLDRKNDWMEARFSEINHSAPGVQVFLLARLCAACKVVGHLQTGTVCVCKGTWATPAWLIHAARLLGTALTLCAREQ